VLFRLLSRAVTTTTRYSCTTRIPHQLFNVLPRRLQLARQVIQLLVHGLLGLGLGLHAVVQVLQQLRLRRFEKHFANAPVTGGLLWDALHFTGSQLRQPVFAFRFDLVGLDRLQIAIGLSVLLLQFLQFSGSGSVHLSRVADCGGCSLLFCQCDFFLLLHHAHLFGQLRIVGFDGQSLSNGREGSVVIVHCRLRGCQAIETLDKGGIQADAFLGVFCRFVPLFQTGVRSAAIGEKDMIVPIFLNGLRVIINRFGKIVRCKSFVSESEK